MKIKLEIFTKGMVMGLAEVIPGVSGSTMALVMGIYDDFINLLYSFSKLAQNCIEFLFRKKDFFDLKQELIKLEWGFAIPLFFGMIVSILSFANILNYFIDKSPGYVLAFFFGLVVASVSIPLQRIGKINILKVILFLFSLTFFYFLLGVDPIELNSKPNLVYVFFGGMLAICAMSLPGISGSFILLLLGLYEYIISIIKDLSHFKFNLSDFTRLVVLSFGVVVGFVLFVRILKWLLSKYEGELMAFLAGLMLASLRILWPFIDNSRNFESLDAYPKVMLELSNTEHLYTIGIILASAVTVLVIKKISDKI